MESWLAAFVIIAAVAIVLQMLILLGMFLQFRQANERISRLAENFESRVNPLLTRIDRLLDDSQSRISSIVADSAEIVHLARSQAQKFDRVFTEAVERLRLQIIHADLLLAGAMEAVEDAGSQFRKTILGPVQQASAFIRGVKTGLEVFRGQRRSPDRTREQQDEGLFI